MLNRIRRYFSFNLDKAISIKRKSEGSEAVCIYKIHPIGNKSKTILNKSGKSSLQMNKNGSLYKVYESQSPQHALFIKEVSMKMPELFPRVYYTNHNWVFAQWINGSRTSDISAKKHIELLLSIHSIPISDMPACDFNYFDHYIVPRFLRAASFFDETQLANTIIKRAKIETEKAIIIHPDLTPSNIIIRKNGELCSIDNELLSFGHNPLLDLCNAIRPLRLKDRILYKNMWEDVHRIEKPELEATSWAWLIRESGAAFISGRFKDSFDLLHSSKHDAINRLPIKK